MGLAQDLGITGNATTSRLARMQQQVGSTRMGASILRRLLPPTDALISRVTRGNRTYTGDVVGVPTVFLTTTGARTQVPRTVPLAAIVTGGGRVSVIGSNWGRAAHPAWVHNLAAHPDASVSFRGRRVAVRAREVTGDEAEEIWRAARILYPGYRTYPERTGGRVIRVFDVEPARPRTSEPPPT